MSKRLILNADDFGLSESVNKGIVQAHRAGTVSSTTLMANMPGFADAVQLAKEVPTLSVGLHFNLTFGRPLSPPGSVRSLVRTEGTFSQDRQAWQEDDVERELMAQWNRCIYAGLRPDHLDSHHHIQVQPSVYASMIKLATRERIPMRRTGYWRQALKSDHPPTTDVMIMEMYGNGDGREILLRHFESLCEGEVTEIVCHPGYVDDVVRAISNWVEVREAELQVFTDPVVVKRMEQLRIQRVDFGAAK